MFGFLVGTACLIGLYKVVGGGWGYGRGRGWRGRGGWMLRGLFRRLDTTVGQEKAISESFEALREQGRRVREEAVRFRRDAAAAFRGPNVDHEPLKAAFARQDTLLQELQREVLVSLGKVHEALDERQRRELADLIESGFARGCGHRAYSRCGGSARFDDRHTAQAI